jgi:hypothetical protein
VKITMDSLWNTRKRATNIIKNKLKAEDATIDQAFSLLDEMLYIFRIQNKVYYRVTGLTLLKGRNLAMGMYSLALDGLAQEAGALLRPLVECLELLTYFYNEPQRIDEALEGRLPDAGKVGKRIHGKFQPLRDYLNKHASHYSFTPESMSHLIDFKTGDWRVNQLYNKTVLRKNMSTLFAILVQLLYQSANILAEKDLLPNSIEERLNTFKQNGSTVFMDTPK